MTHFKAVFTSILYAGVLFLGLAAILGSVDVLLFSIDNRAYLNTAIIVWVLFAPIYYLSLLPRFHLDSEEAREKAEHAARCPRFLEILLSYIAIPLLAAFTAVLAAYFIKILITLKWPSGQLGPMVLGYSAAGLILYVLAGNLENRAAALYRAIFPKALIPVVILQIVSIVIRLNAYGVTEPRYYVALFAVFSLICAALFSFLNKSHNQIIAPLAAIFALISALPPVDAFTVSRMSQVGRLESILSQQGMLQNGKLTPKTDLSNEVKQKVGNLLSYLNSAGHLSYVTWLPKGFVLYEDMEKTFGFGFDTGNASSYSDVHLDTAKAIDTSGYNVMLDVSSYRYENMQSTVPLAINGIDYQLQTKRLSDYDLQLSLLNSNDRQLVSTQLYSFAKTVLVNAQSLALPPETLTLEAKADGYKLRVVFTGIYQEAGSGVDYQYYVLVGVPS